MVTSQSPRRAAAEPCRGGVFSGFREIARLTASGAITRGFDLLKLEPGQYRIRYKFSRFVELGSGCAEMDAGRFDNPDKDTGEVTLSVEAGKVYRLTLLDDFTVAVETLEELPLDDMSIWAIAETIRGTTRWRDMCSQLFPPADKTHFASVYEKSSVSRYATSLGFVPPPAPYKTESREDLLSSLRQTETEAFHWCRTGYVSDIERFDHLFGNRIDEVNEYLLRR